MMYYFDFPQINYIGQMSLDVHMDVLMGLNSLTHLTLLPSGIWFPQVGYYLQDNILHNGLVTDHFCEFPCMIWLAL